MSPTTGLPGHVLQHQNKRHDTGGIGSEAIWPARDEGDKQSDGDAGKAQQDKRAARRHHSAIRLAARRRNAI
jgi:hypothetical protein